MKVMTLKERIEEAQNEMMAYPNWVVENSVFQGGAPSEFRQEETDGAEVTEPHEELRILIGED